jgi:hypothetical protein
MYVCHPAVLISSKEDILYRQTQLIYVTYFIVAACPELYSHFQASNIKLIKVLYTVVLGAIGIWDLKFTIKTLLVTMSDFVYNSQNVD